MPQRIFAVIIFTLCFPFALGQDQALLDDQKKMAQLSRLAETQGKKAVNPTSEIVFPQVANGLYYAGGVGYAYATSIVLTSNENVTFTVTLQFYAPNGAPLHVHLSDSVTGTAIGTSNIFSVSIPPRESVFLETDGTGSITTGWARAIAPAGRTLGGVAAYQLFEIQTGELLALVGVGASAATPGFFMPVFRSTSLASNTAIAVANSSNETAYLKVYLLGNQRFPNASGTFSLGPKQQRAVYVNQLFPSMGDVFFGTMHVFRVDANEEVYFKLDIHPVALLDSRGLFSSIPVTNIVSLQ